VSQSVVSKTPWSAYNWQHCNLFHGETFRELGVRTTVRSKVDWDFCWVAGTPHVSEARSKLGCGRNGGITGFSVSPPIAPPPPSPSGIVAVEWGVLLFCKIIQGNIIPFFMAISTPKASHFTDQLMAKLPRLDLNVSRGYSSKKNKL